MRAAIVNSGLVYPRARLTVNLAPADLRKEGPAYDLPIAVGLLLATEQVSGDLTQTGLVGKLSLDGPVRHVPIDPESFAYCDEGLLPNFEALPTCKCATPHNIQPSRRRTRRATTVPATLSCF